MSLATATSALVSTLRKLLRDEIDQEIETTLKVAVAMAARMPRGEVMRVAGCDATELTVHVKRLKRVAPNL
jgi:hypothetical protein